MNKKNLIKNKKGISIVIGYVLLIAVSVAMSVLVYQFLKTYIPKDTMACPDGTSVFVRDVNYDCGTGILKITLQNNGKFAVGGYFIHASNSATPKDALATIDLSGDISGGGTKSGTSIIYSTGGANGFNPDDIPKTSQFNVVKTMETYGTLTKIEIIPTRYQTQDNFQQYVSCSNAKVQQILTCA